MEIDLDLSYSPEEVSFLDMHTVVNVLHVIRYEVLRLSGHLGSPEELEKLAEEISAACGELFDPEKATHRVHTIDTFIDGVEDTLAKLEKKLGVAGDAVVEGSRKNLNSVFEILRVRAEELADRRNHPKNWVIFAIDHLHWNFRELFRAIERNSHGGYRIVTNLAEKEKNDYLIHFEIGSPDEEAVAMPPVFQDVMRDLLANARKYTRPGGTIDSGLSLVDGELRFVVTDNGIGIPESELQEVVRFGYRASNVRDRPTRGGGFGLTKAYYVTRAFSGRFWIDSPVTEGRGTRMEIRLPVPAVITS